MPLWPHQLRAIEEARARYREGRRAIVLVMPTGGGKTRVAVALCDSAIAKGGQGLWVVHRAELIRQAAADLEQAGGIRPGIIAPWAQATAAPIQVASIQTLLARGERPPATLMIWDECHHAVADTYHEVAKHYSGGLRIGLTATPERQDGVALGNLYDAMVVACQPAELVKAGHLVPSTVKAPFARMGALAEDPVRAFQTMAPNRKGVVFAASARHAQALADSFTSRGIPAASVDGKLDNNDRLLALDRFRRGKLRILTNVHVLTEGWDEPSADCAILARGFSSQGSYLQAVGRVLRAAPGKTDALVIDLHGASHDHGLPDEPREYSLEGRAIRSADGLEPVTQCKACGSVFRAHQFRDATCPACGSVRRGRQDPKVKRAILQTMAARETVGHRIEFLRSKVAIARLKNYRPSWALVQFKVKYGQWPTDEERSAAWRVA